jgi:hypothetical protein
MIADFHSPISFIEFVWWLTQALQQIDWCAAQVGIGDGNIFGIETF